MMLDNYIIKHLRLNYDDKLCNCLKSLFVTNNNLLKELLKVTRYYDNDTKCIYDLIPDKTMQIIYVVWVEVSPFIEADMSHNILHCNLIRQYAQLDSSNLNMNYKEDISGYVIKLLKEVILYSFPYKGKNLLLESFRKYYEPFYNHYKNTNKDLMDYSEFLKYVNPLFNYNYLNSFHCINDDNHLQVLFVPNIHQIASLTLNSKINF